jgi:hypothetical protein
MSRAIGSVRHARTLSGLLLGGNNETASGYTIRGNGKTRNGKFDRIVKLVRAEIDLREINRLADEHEKETGHRATRMGELVQAGLLKGVPRDPAGYPYVLGEDGKAELNLNSPLLELMLMLIYKK